MKRHKKTDGSAVSSNIRYFNKIRIEKYRTTRYWGIWLDEELLAVTVYKRGALAIKGILGRDMIDDSHGVKRESYSDNPNSNDMNLNGSSSV